WHSFNDAANDTVNRVISVGITQFGLPGDNSTDGGDVLFFDIAHLMPLHADLDVSQQLILNVTYIAVPGANGGGDEIFYLPKPIHSWYVNGIQNGNATVGTIINIQGQTAIYKAPAQIPSPNTVEVGALVNTRINHRGRVLEQFMLTSRITIKSSVYHFHLKINELADWYARALYPCFLTDGVDMDITVDNGNNTVSINNILNRLPNVAPPGGPYSGGTVEWLPGSPPDFGTINVTDVEGSVYYSLGVKYFNLNFNHNNCKFPRFIVRPENGNPYFIGGQSVPGHPVELNFVDKDSSQTLVPPNYGGEITAILTVTQ